MGDMADLEIERMEKGSTYVFDKKTGKKIIVDNMLLMYSTYYDDETKYEILGDVE